MRAMPSVAGAVSPPRRLWFRLGSIGMVAGGQGTGFVGSRHAAYIDGAASVTGHVARGVAGGQGTGFVGSHHAADTRGAGDVA